MFKEKLINQLKVVPVQAGIGKWDKTNCRGFDITGTPYWTMFISARKKSGKSSLINLITQKCTDKRTSIWLFSSTYAIDPTLIEIIQSLEKKGNCVTSFDSLFDGKTNILDDIMHEINQGEPKEEEKEEPVRKCVLKFNESPSSTKKKEYKPKKTAPKHLFIFDDFPAKELRSASIAKLLKTHRHSFSSVIISSQYMSDLQPQSILQLDIFIGFKAISLEKMQMIHKLLDLSIEFSTFWEIYKHCTFEPYSFMFLDIKNEKFRCQLNKQIEY